MQGVGVVAVVADVQVGAALQQEPHAFEPVVGRGAVQRGSPLEIDPAGVQQIRIGVEQAAKIVGAPLGSRRLDGGDRPLHVLVALVAPLVVA